ncbi:hypothetical protein RS130_01015 [Paraglaciecola aquimarina]|uniref:Cyclic nucleotide-binding domain-containing protein n=1 Tax=Paraglaciecola aquimarina TaxID=1235557 RepID=A0ABU3SRP5_9ALTE|nr:hypothetical protein [Paraglaciecola aquimarina]MDU0352681.1 hypothetical protein [Paraglaciecola aquimarina]
MTQEQAFLALRRSMETYSPLSNETWQFFKQICTFKSLPSQSVLYRAGEIPKSFSYIVKGLVRCFVSDEKGNEYNKIFFEEGMFHWLHDGIA